MGPARRRDLRSGSIRGSAQLTRHRTASRAGESHSRTYRSWSPFSIAHLRAARVSVIAVSPSRPISRRRQPTTVPVRPQPPRQATATRSPRTRRAWRSAMNAAKSPRCTGTEPSPIGNRTSSNSSRFQRRSKALNLEHRQLVVLDEPHEGVDANLVTQRGDVVGEVAPVLPGHAPVVLARRERHPEPTARVRRDVVHPDGFAHRPGTPSVVSRSMSGSATSWPRMPSSHAGGMPSMPQ